MKSNAARARRLSLISALSAIPVLSAISVLSAAVASIGLFAPSRAARADEATKPADVERFHALVGQWRGTATLDAEGGPVAVAVTLDCRDAAGGWGIACEMTGNGKDLTMRESDLMGVDPVTGTSHWYAITNMGETHDHVVTWSDDHEFHARHSWSQEGKAMAENIVVRLPQPGTLEFKSVVTADGQSAGAFAGKLSR